MEIEVKSKLDSEDSIPDNAFWGLAGLREHLSHALSIAQLDAALVISYNAQNLDIVASLGLDHTILPQHDLRTLFLGNEPNTEPTKVKKVSTDFKQLNKDGKGDRSLVAIIDHDQQIDGRWIGLRLLGLTNQQLDQSQSRQLKLLIGTIGLQLRHVPDSISAPQIGILDLKIIDAISGYYLIINEQEELFFFGSSFKKSIPNLKSKILFPTLFKWEGKVTTKQLFAVAYPKNELFFLQVQSLNQRYQCNVKLIDQNHLLILANPVINSVYPISVYKVGLIDFASHDYISEYLFLQETIRSASKETEGLTKEIIEKNIQLQQAKDQLLHINKILEIKVEEKSKHINNLTYYPEHNPNPVLEVDIKHNIITYVNPVAKKLFQLEANNTVSTWLSAIGLSLAELNLRKRINISFEFLDRYFEGKLFYIPSSNFVRFYLTDQTVQRHKEQQIAIQNKRVMEQQQILMSFKSLEPTMGFNTKIEQIIKVVSGYLSSTNCTYWAIDPGQPTTMNLLMQNDKSVGLLKLSGDSQDANQFPSYFRQIYHSNNVISSGIGSEIFIEHYPNQHEFNRPVTRRFDIPVRRFMSLIGVLVLEFEHLDEEVTPDLLTFLDKLADPIALAYQTDQLYNSNIKLAQKTQSLETAMQALVSAQDELIRQERLVTLGQLIAGMAHEINTPLGAIKASVELIIGGLEDGLLGYVLHLSPQDCQLAIKLYLDNSTTFGHLSPADERQLVNQLEQKITVGFPNLLHARLYARRIVEIGYSELTEDIAVVLTNKDARSILDFSASFARLSRAAQTINLAVDKSTKVVRALNNYAHGNTENTIRSFSLYDNIENVLTILWNRIKADSLVKNAIDQSVMIVGNQEELSQVWTNLINNAVQASRGKCSVYITHQLQGQDHVISFTNDGPQIPPEVLPKIFDAFFTTKRVGEGTGIGLNICKQIIERHKGTITCQSTTDSTVFTINLPHLVADVANADPE